MPRFHPHSRPRIAPLPPSAEAGARSVESLLVESVRRLSEAGIDTARLDARLLLSSVLDCETGSLIVDRTRPVAAADTARFIALIDRRVAREPVSQILGRWGFWTLSFRVSAQVLTPRPDSETLVMTALTQLPDRLAPLRIVDFGTGSGCLLLSLLHELPNATGVGVDLSPEALSVAAANADDLGLTRRVAFRRGDWAAALTENDGPFDILLSNPPYIPSADINGLEPEVARFEPRLALDGGPDGLAPYRALTEQAARLLGPNGLALFEVGMEQAVDVEEMLQQQGFRNVSTALDLGGIGRCVHGRRAAGQS